MAYNVTCTPGQDASAAYMRITEEIPALVLYLDPVNLAVQLPPFPGGDQVLARFCREVAREAAKLADALESGRTSPRHMLTEGDDL